MKDESISADTPLSAPAALPCVPEEAPTTDTPHPDETMMIAIEEIAEDPDRPNYRSPTQKAIQELAETLRTQGQLEPCRVRPAKPDATHGKPWELVFGYRRKAAAELLGWETLRCEVKDESDVDVLLHRITENAERENPSPIEEARIIRDLIDQHGYSQSKIAKLLGRDPSQISHRLSLLRLPDSVQERVHTGTLRVSAAEVISTLQDETAQERVAAQAASRGWPTKKVEEWVNTVRADSARSHELAPIEMPEIAAYEIIDLKQLTLRADLTDKAVKRVILYGQLRNWLDAEMLEYLESEFGVTYDTLWDYVHSLDDSQVWDLCRRMAVRYITAAHRYPSLERSLRLELGTTSEDGEAGRDDE